MTRAEAVRHAEGWIDAWNAHDLDRILSFYSEDVVFEAETVKKR
jgi:ketosteroid isomerase-like protein